MQSLRNESTQAFFVNLKTKKMTNEIVISPVRDEKMNSHINESEVWKKAFKAEELTDRIKGMHPAWYEYTIRFDGLKPIQMTKFREI